MKKLFSYLLIASVLTFSSCTNYDDQFADLEASIEALKTQVAGFSTLSASLTTLQSSVAEVKTSIANLPGNDALEADLEALSATVSALTASLESLAGIVATGESTTEAINAAVAAIEANQDALATALADVATAQAAAATAASTSSEAATQALADAVAELKAVGTTDLAALTSAIAAVEAAQATYQATSSDEATALADAIAALTTAQAAGTADLSALINAVQTAQTAANAVAIANQTATSAAITASQTALADAIAALTTAEAAGTADLTALINAVQDAQTVAATAAAANQAEMLASNSALADTQTALTAAIVALQADLDTVGSTTAATKIVADLLSESLALLQVGQTANTASIAQLIASVSALPADADIANVITVVSAAVTASTEEMIATILENNDVLTGGLSITNAAELAYAVSVSNQLAIINGDLTVTKSVANGLSAADISAVTSLVNTVVGSVTIITDADLDFSGLTSVSVAYSVTGSDVSDDNLSSVGGAVNLNYDGGYSQPSLTNTGAITLTNYNSSVLAGSVTTTTVDLSGLSAAPSLTVSGTTFGDLDGFTDAISINTGSVAINNATSGNLLSLTAKIDPAGATISTASATTVVLNGDLDSGTLSATLESATSLTINSTDITGTELHVNAPLASVSMPSLTAIDGNLTVLSASSFSAPALAVVSGSANITSTSVNFSSLETVVLGLTTDMPAGSTLSMPSMSTIPAASTLSATTISLPALGQVTGTLAITGDLTANALTIAQDISLTGSSISANALEEAGAITLTGPNSVSLPSLATAGIITADEAVTFSAPSLDVSAAVNTVSATTVVLSSIDVPSNIADRAFIEDLKLNASTGLDADDFSALSSLTVVGTGTVTLTSSNTALESVNISGVHSALDVSGTASLTSLVTAGTIETLTISNTGLVSFTPGHQAIALSSVTVNNNASLLSLTTSTDYLGDLTVTGNASLTTVDFSSYQSVSNSQVTATINISGNDLSAAITSAIAANGAIAFQEASIASAGLSTLKAAVAAHVAVFGESFLSLTVNPTNVTIDGTAGALTSVTQVTGSVLDGSDLINTSAEFALID